MKITLKQLSLFALLALFLSIPAIANAAVYFMENTEPRYTRPGLEKPCYVKGYNFSQAICDTMNKVGKDECIEDSKSYFKTCVCDTDKYKWDAANCTNNQTLSGKICEGKYDTCKCDAKYRYTSVTCPSPKERKGATCREQGDSENRYDECVCPSTYDKACPAPQTGVGTACDGKYQSCACPAAWGTCSQMGPGVGSTKCESNSVTYYSTCCTCDSYEQYLSDANATKYENCQCNDTYRRASECAAGWKVNQSTGRCVPMTCGESIDALFAADTAKKFNAYGVYKGAALSAKTTLIIGDDVTNGNTSHFINKTVTSGVNFAKQLSASIPMENAVKTKCTVTPTVKVTTSGYSGAININSVKLTATTLTTYSTFKCTNCTIDVSTWNSYGVTHLLYSASLPNNTGLKVNFTSALTIDSDFASLGYDFTSTSGTMSIWGGSVVIAGRDSNNYGTARVSKISVRGTAGFQYYNIHATNSYIGLSAANSGAVWKTVVSLYDSTWWLAEGTNYNRYMYFGATSVMGNTSTGGGNTGSNAHIKTKSADFKSIRYPLTLPNRITDDSYWVNYRSTSITWMSRAYSLPTMSRSTTSNSGIYYDSNVVADREWYYRERDCFLGICGSWHYSWLNCRTMDLVGSIVRINGDSSSNLEWNCVYGGTWHPEYSNVCYKCKYNIKTENN
ncbi:MAG: hypothetical protein LBR70_02880 [Lactobacillaceae bacterium]|jgi:hypothetical protein|nr:hypothetical protein [Lactobacillaceae bacterium]